MRYERTPNLSFYAVFRFRIEEMQLVHDDLLATGGTMKAACELIRKFGVKKIYVNFLVELDFLKGREQFDKDIMVDSLIHY